MTARRIDYPISQTKDQVLAEITATISKNNPNIGYIKSVLLKNGPRVYKYAIIYQVLNAETQEHHHFVLKLGAYQKFKAGWQKEDHKSIQIDDEEIDEIGYLQKFINVFKELIPADSTKYGIIEEKFYELFNKKINSETSNDDINAILEDSETYNQVIELGGLSLFKDLLKSALEKKDGIQLISKLNELNISDLKDINAITGVSYLHKFYNIWLENQNNSKEEFWQNLFEENSWAISKAFSVPLILFEDKAFIGGKNIHNKNGNIADFIFQNKLSENVALIEIKTPVSKLLGSPYRQTYTMSNEMSGAVNQVLKYKHVFQKNYFNLVGYYEGKFEVLNPKTLLIIGNHSVEINDSIKNEAFELYRGNLKDVEIITFDELFAKVKMLINLLEGNI